MKGLKLQLIIFVFLLTIYACANGSKRPRFDSFPIRNEANSVYMQCEKLSTMYACKTICTKYTKKNKCKKGHSKVEKKDTGKLLKKGFVMMSRELYLKLLLRK